MDGEFVWASRIRHGDEYEVGEKELLSIMKSSVYDKFTLNITAYISDNSYLGDNSYHIQFLEIGKPLPEKSILSIRVCES